MRTASLWPLTILPQICTVLCVRNCKSILMQLWKCFLTLRLAGLAMHQTTMKTKGRQLQRACKTTWLSSEATIRARCEILGIRAALKQLSENKNDAMCVVWLRLMKTKYFNMLLSFCQLWHFTWQNWATFFRRDVLTLHRWKLQWNCTSISSLMPLLNPSLKLIAKSLIVNLGISERRMVWLSVSSGMAFYQGTERLANWLSP